VKATRRELEVAHGGAHWGDAGLAQLTAGAHVSRAVWRVGIAGQVSVQEARSLLLARRLDADGFGRFALPAVGELVVDRAGLLFRRRQADEVVHSQAHIRESLGGEDFVWTKGFLFSIAPGAWPTIDFNNALS
jgi:hypothetical protein